MALGPDRRPGAVALPGKTDPIVTVTNRHFKRRVDAAGEEIEVEQTIAPRQAHPQLEIEG